MFPAETGSTLARVWQIRPGRADEPDTMYCGAEPAALFMSNDAGASWSLCRGLYDHPRVNDCAIHSATLKSLNAVAEQAQAGVEVRDLEHLVVESGQPRAPEVLKGARVVE